MEILNNPNKKFCPYKNCDSYGEKTSNEKYIKCKNGHQFCFVCLRNWYDKEECDKKEEDDFKVWKEGKIIKKCPNCHIYTEKNEGCNHMTCLNANINGVGCIMENILMIIIQKENVLVYNFINQLMKKILKEFYHKIHKKE